MNVLLTLLFVGIVVANLKKDSTALLSLAPTSPIAGFLDAYVYLVQVLERWSVSGREKWKDLAAVATTTLQEFEDAEPSRFCLKSVRADDRLC